MNDLVKQWKEAARRDDLFNHMVPSNVRQLIGEIERLRRLLRGAAVKRQDCLSQIDQEFGTEDQIAEEFGSVIAPEETGDG